MAIDDDKDTNVESGAAMGFGGGVDLGNVNVGAAYDADRGGLGSGLGLTDAQGHDLGFQTSAGKADAWGPSFGSRSGIGTAVGTGLGLLAGIPGAGLVGAYGPGLVNSIMGRGNTPVDTGIFDDPGANSIGGSGGLLGVGNDTSQADALAALYTLLMAKQKAA